MSKFLLVGDVHYAQKYEKEIDIFEQEVLEIIGREDVGFIIFMGDVFDNVREKYFNETTLLRFTKFIRSIPGNLKIFILVGNHDLFNTHRIGFNKDDTILTHIFQNDGNVRIIWEPMIIELDAKFFIMTPYIKKNLFNIIIDDLLEKFTAELPGEQISLCFAHQEFYGSGYSKDKDVDKYCYPFKCYSGHIHKPTNLYGGNVVYVGESFKHNFDDKIYACRYIMLDISNGNFNEISLYGKCPTRIKIMIEFHTNENGVENGVERVIGERLDELSAKLRGMDLKAYCKCFLMCKEQVFAREFKYDNITAEFIFNEFSLVTGRDGDDLQCEENINVFDLLRGKVLDYIDDNQDDIFNHENTWQDFLKCIGVVTRSKRQKLEDDSTTAALKKKKLFT